MHSLKTVITAGESIWAQNSWSDATGQTMLGIDDKEKNPKDNSILRNSALYFHI